MSALLNRIYFKLKVKSEGMEMVQVAILIAIAIAAGLIFKTQINKFVNKVFSNLMNAGF